MAIRAIFLWLIQVAMCLNILVDQARTQEGARPVKLLSTERERQGAVKLQQSMALATENLKGTRAKVSILHVVHAILNIQG